MRWKSDNSQSCVCRVSHLPNLAVEVTNSFQYQHTKARSVVIKTAGCFFAASASRIAVASVLRPLGSPFQVPGKCLTTCAISFTEVGAFPEKGVGLVSTNAATSMGKKRQHFGSEYWDRDQATRELRARFLSNKIYTICIADGCQNIRFVLIRAQILN